MGGRGSGREANHERRAEMARLRGLGLTFAEIGLCFGVSRQCVQYTLTKMGYGRPPELTSGAEVTVAARPERTSMKLSRASSYALAALVYLAWEKPDAPVASHDIARAEGIPERFILKVMRSLVHAGILRSLKGPNGGYSLARAPKDVTLLEVIEAVDGPLRALAEPVGKGTDPLDKKLQALYDEALALVRGRLAKMTLVEFARGTDVVKGERRRGGNV